MTKPIEPRLTIVALHGVADTPEEIDAAFAYVVKHISSPLIRWVFPKASRRPVTLLGGSEAFAWYDIRTHDLSHLDDAGIHAAVGRVREMIRAERAKIRPDQKLAVVGFSQGGALALQSGLIAQGEVDGIVALSTAVPLPEEVPRATENSPRVFLGHGMRDNEVPLSLGLDTYNLLFAKGYKVDWHEYHARHTVEGRELRDVARWLNRYFLGDPQVRDFGSNTAPQAHRAL
jgi:phospholipase/carboxylesterase